MGNIIMITMTKIAVIAMTDREMLVVEAERRGETSEWWQLTPGGGDVVFRTGTTHPTHLSV